MDAHLVLDRVFAEDYSDARRRFAEAVEARGGEIASYRNPNPGPEGEELATDVAWFGPKDATAVLVQMSATHGVEGFCGSGAQVDWLLNGQDWPLPEGVAVLMIHAINPYGFAWIRRCTEEGCDLNRNYVDFDRPLPENPGYEELKEDFIPPELEGPEFEAAEERLEAYREKHGSDAFKIAWGGGQYTDSFGCFYGGTGPTWSRRTLETIVADYDLAARKLVAVIDYHTGLGPFGYGELISAHTVGSENVERAKRWYGLSVTQPDLGTSASVPKTGLGEIGWERLLGERVSCIAIEYGTFTPEEGRVALRADHWLHKHRNVDWTAAETREIKIGLKRHFYPETADWQEMVLLRSRMVVRQALEALARER